MAAGDAQRKWWPEMLEELRAFWRPGLSWEEVVEFCARMTAMRKEIRAAHGIGTQKRGQPELSEELQELLGRHLGKCPRCGSKGGSVPEGRISLRSLLFSLRKIDLVTEDQFKELDRDWKKFRKLNGLDAYGNAQQQSKGSILHMKDLRE